MRGYQTGSSRRRPTLTQPSLDEFCDAAARGRWVWVETEAAQVRVCAGLRRRRQAPPMDIGALFVAALRERYGDAASAVAERQLQLHDGCCEPMPSQTIDAAVLCAASAQALQDAGGAVLRFEYSARLLGRGFVALCSAQGLDARRISLARRQAIDTALGGMFEAAEAPSAEQVRLQLQELLTNGLH